jgi:hypothetical protein
MEDELENHAASTLFFSQGVINGKVQNNCRVNYLALLNLDSDDVTDSVEIIKQIVAEEQSDTLKRDTLALLQARNWRFHLIACGVLLTGFQSSALFDQLWNTLQQGSWVSPQLAATACLIDSEFRKRAFDLLTHEDSDEKSIVSVAQLLNQDSKTKFTVQQDARISSARAKDHDNSGQLSIAWVEKAKALFIT